VYSHLTYSWSIQDRIGAIPHHKFNLLDYDSFPTVYVFGGLVQFKLLLVFSSFFCVLWSSSSLVSPALTIVGVACNVSLLPLNEIKDEF